MGNLNIDVLMEAAGKKLGIPPEKLREALGSGNFSEIASKLSREDREKIQAVLNNPELSEKFKRQFMNGGR